MSQKKNRSNSTLKEHDGKEKSSGSGLVLGTLLAAGAGALIGILGKSLYDEVKEQEHRQVNASHASCSSSRSVPIAPPNECGICLEPVSASKLEQLPCMHIFHKNCLLESFDNSHFCCPFCRYKLSSEQVQKYRDRA